MGQRGHRSWVKRSKGHRSRGHRSYIKRVTNQVAKVKGLKILGGGTATIILSISFQGYFHYNEALSHLCIRKSNSSTVLCFKQH